MGALLGLFLAALDETMVATALSSADPAGLPPLDAALAGVDRAEQQAKQTVDNVGQALKEAFTEAISTIYQIAAEIALIGFLVRLALPELPLRRSNRLEAPPPME